MVTLLALIAAGADCAALFFSTHALIRLPARCSGTLLPVRIVNQCSRFHVPTSSRILLVYVAGQAASSIMLIPGGLGPVEAAMTMTFIAGKIRPVPALSAVLLYRLLSYWGVVLIGLACWAYLRRKRSAPAAANAAAPPEAPPRC